MAKKPVKHCTEAELREDLIDEAANVVSHLEWMARHGDSQSACEVRRLAAIMRKLGLLVRYRRVLRDNRVEYMWLQPKDIPEWRRHDAEHRRRARERAREQERALSSAAKPKTRRAA